jgi:hypothetical protein
VEFETKIEKSKGNEIHFERILDDPLNTKTTHDRMSPGGLSFDH